MKFGSANNVKQSDKRNMERTEFRKSNLGENGMSSIENVAARSAGGNRGDVNSQQSAAGQYYMLQRPNHVSFSGSDPFSSSNPMPSLGLQQLTSSLYPHGVWNPTFPDMGRNPESIHSSLTNNAANTDILTVSGGDSNSSQGRNPQFASLIHTQNVLCRQLEQLTDHNINLATRNSALRAELEQAKEENLHMIQVRQMQAQQALKQAHDYEDLLLKFEKSGETIRQLRGNKKPAKNGKQQKDESENSDVIDEVKLTVLRRDNSVLRLKIQELQEKNMLLESRVEELTSIVDGAEGLVHDPKHQRKTDEKNESLKSGRKPSQGTPPTTTLLRANTKDAALPTAVANRQVTNEIALPPFLKRQGTSELANPTVNNRQVTNEVAILSNLKRQSSRSDQAQNFYQAKMDKTFSNHPDQNVFNNLTNSLTPVKPNNSAGPYALDGDLRDEDESTDEDVDSAIGKRNGESKEDSSAITKLLHASKSIGDKNEDKQGKAESRIPISRIMAALNTPGTVAKRKRGRPKRDKSEGWPKRPLSAYNLFFREQRIRILDSLATENENIDEKDDLGKDDQCEDTDEGEKGENKKKRGRPFGSGKKRRRATPHGIITFENLGKKISRDWKEAPEEEKAKYKEEAAINLIKYQRELEIFLRKRQIRVEETIARETLARRQHGMNNIDLVSDDIHEKNP